MKNCDEVTEQLGDAGGVGPRRWVKAASLRTVTLPGARPAPLLAPK